MREADFIDILKVAYNGLYTDITIGDYNLIILIDFKNKHYNCEIAIFKFSAILTDDELLRGFYRFDELKCYEYISTKTFYSVPIDLIQDLYEYLKVHDNLQSFEKRDTERIMEAQEEQIDDLINDLEEYEEEIEGYLDCINGQSTLLRDNQRLIDKFKRDKSNNDYILFIKEFVIEGLKEEIEQLERTVETQDKTISEILDEMEEYEEEIDDLKSLSEGQSKSLIEKDKEIEQLEGFILKQREEIIQLRDYDEWLDDVKAFEMQVRQLQLQHLDLKKEMASKDIINIIKKYFDIY